MLSNPKNGTQIFYNVSGYIGRCLLVDRYDVPKDDELREQVKFLHIVSIPKTHLVVVEGALTSRTDLPQNSDDTKIITSLLPTEAFDALDDAKLAYECSNSHIDLE